MTTLQVIAPTASAFAAATSAFVATRALGVNRRSALITQLLDAYGDMITALHQIASEAERVDRDALTSTEIRSFDDFAPALAVTEPALRPIHEKYAAAAARAALVEPVAAAGYTRRGWPSWRGGAAAGADLAAHGQWVRQLAGRLAWSLVDVSAAQDVVRMQLKRRWSLPRREPEISDDEWEILSRNAYYLHVANILSQQPQPRSPFERLEARARRAVLGHQHGYHTQPCLHMPQVAAILDDFTRDFVETWCQFVAIRVSGRQSSWT